ncbi:hypothetical protein RJ641_032733 [Dillenia turbinata]|uniref:Protein CHUP1, chloroplastic n=1 Tax=Dillenia turbinata TaxID=194707 RepID=A0AAN8ZIX4_9MAGN
MGGDDEDSEITNLKQELKSSRARTDALENENKELKQEIVLLKAQIVSLRAQNHERKSILWKKFQSSIDSNNADGSSPEKLVIHVKVPEQNAADEKLIPMSDSPESDHEKERLTRIPKPPPRPTITSPLLAEKNASKMLQTSAQPPPPPPLPSKQLAGSKAVRRMPEIMEFYRSLTRRKDACSEKKANPTRTATMPDSRNMIGEIENRSTYLLAIKSDVETQGEFINYLAREVEAASFSAISDVETFVKWLDKELSALVDERAVLKHFPQWPERKADALREAAFTYRDMKNLETEVSTFEDNLKQPLTHALRKIQALQYRLEQNVDNNERIRESTSRRYRDLQIPWEWMQDTGMTGQLKLSSMRLATAYMKRIAKVLKSNECKQEEDLMLQGARFAFRVHQFAGGFDTQAMQAFEQLRKLGSNCHKQYNSSNTSQTS